jgi:hypothetical protein
MDEYDLGAIVKFTGGEAGLLYQLWNAQVARLPSVYGATPANSPFTQYLHVLDPYFKYATGPLFIEGEFIWGFGDYINYDNPKPAPDVKINSIGAYLNAKFNVGPAYVGGIFAYSQGDDPATPDKLEGGGSKWQLAGDDFNPCLILWNSDYTTMVGNIRGNAIDPFNNPLSGVSNEYNSPYSNDVQTYFDNAWLWQFYAGVKPIPKLELKAAYTYAYADEKPTIFRMLPPNTPLAPGVTNNYFVGRDYGYELDVSATYKIFDNLSYMIGAGYLWAGDYFKGIDQNVDVTNNYIVVNKLQLNF